MPLYWGIRFLTGEIESQSHFKVSNIETQYQKGPPGGPLCVEKVSTGNLVFLSEKCSYRKLYRKRNPKSLCHIDLRRRLIIFGRGGPSEWGNGGVCRKSLKLKDLRPNIIKFTASLHRRNPIQDKTLRSGVVLKLIEG